MMGGCNPRVFRRMTHEQRQRYMQRVAHLHRNLAIIGAVGVPLALGGAAYAVLAYVWRVAA